MKYTFVALSFFINIPTLYAASASSTEPTTSKKFITAKQIALNPIGAAKTPAKPTATKATTQRKNFTSNNKPTTTKKSGHKAAPPTNTVSDLMVIGRAMSTTTKSSTPTPVVGKDIATLQPADDDDTKTLFSDQNNEDKDNGPVVITGGVDLSDWPGLDDSDDSDDDELGDYARAWIEALYGPENMIYL